ncbi:hypothetical protein [Amycolatopsis sp. NPDC049159]|uniref:hypothetical protein n=1 Tax=Amycolatopsis sp. NPDC049159 TaxID=3157210 RepID=UPI0033DEC7FF
MSDAVYDYPVRPATRTRARRRVLVLAAAVLLLLGGGATWIVTYVKDRSSQCDGTPGRTGEGYDLTRQDGDGQCTGWLTSLDYAFGSTDPAAAGVIHKIVAENQRVAQQSVPYVRVAVMMPMTAQPDSKLSAGPIVHALEGAYTAQTYTNSETTPYGEAKPQIQLVLANIGRDQNQWPEVVEGLGSLTTGEHPLVAVTGMGVSVPQTRDAAKRLNSAWHLPSIGSVLTADDMTTREIGSEDKPGLFKVSPSNHAYVTALQKALGPVGKGYLVRDRNPDDYVETLGDDFVDVFAPLKLNDHLSWFNGSTGSSTGSTGLFEDAVNAIGIGDPDVVFYAGRDADLPGLVRSLKFRQGDGASRQLVLAVGVTGLVVVPTDQPGADGAPLTTRDLLDARVTVLAASSTDPDGWAQGVATPEQYPAFRARFTTGSAAFPSADLADGYAIMQFDAVAAAITAIHSVYVRNSAHVQKPALPTAADVRDKLTSYRDTPIRGATGTFYWTEQQPPNDLWPIGHPVPVLRFPASGSRGTVYTTECQRLDDPLNRAAYKVKPCATN